MAVIPILTFDQRILREKAKKIDRPDEKLQRLIDDMAETMHAANGVGLAAPQVGALLRLCLVEVPEDEQEPFSGKLLVLVNPHITSSKGEQFGPEGCLSLPGYWANVRRAAEVTVKARNRRGKEIKINATGLLARALQHEIDHLDGILFTDYLESLDELHRVEEAQTVEEREAVAHAAG